MKEARCDAVVLALMDYGEADRIATIFTAECGKVRGIARHARKSRRRFGGALEPFARLRVAITEREGLSFLREADIIDLHSGIREDLLKIAHAGYACELVDRLVPEGQQNRRLFRLLTAYLEHLHNVAAGESDRRFFEANLLNILGYRLSLESCQCGHSLVEGGASPRLAGSAVRCHHCSPAGRPLSAAAISLLRLSLNTGRFGTIIFASADLAGAGELIDAAIAEHLTSPLKSLVFLKDIRLVGNLSEL